MTPKKITDSKSEGLNSISVEYSSICPFNADNSYLLLQHTGGFIRLHDGDGKFIKVLAGLATSSECRWSRSDPNKLFYIGGGNILKQYDVRNGQSSNVRVFTEYSAISGLGESDMSEDGDHMALCGDKREVFVYDMVADKKLPTFGAPAGLNGLYITPDNNVICGGTTGVNMFSRLGVFMRKLAQSQSHMDVMRDTNGDEVLIRLNGADNPPLAGCNNGVEKIRLADGKVTCLWAIGWSPKGGASSLAAHVSCPDKGFALISTYNTNGAQPSQVFKVPLDGLSREYLCDTGTSASSYQAQPKASISRDGSRFVYCSDKDGALDVWLGVLGAAQPTAPPPTNGQPIPNLPAFMAANWKAIDFAKDEGSEWVWHFKVVNGKMTVTVYDKLT